MENEQDKKAAADLIRKKVEAAYLQTRGSPDASHGNSSNGKSSKHQNYMSELMASGKTVAEIQTAWHDYYSGLTDAAKHQVWQEFYATQRQSAKHPTLVEPSRPAMPKRPVKPLQAVSKQVAGYKDKLAGAVKSSSLSVTKAKPKPASPVEPSAEGGRPDSRALHRASAWRSLMFGLAVGSIVMIIGLFGFFNERFIAPFIQPSRSVTNVPLISGSAIGPKPEIIIPKINVQLPVVYGVSSIEEPDIQKALEGGVVHYADTALPGEKGNVVIVGHSSNNIFNSGNYKFAFVLLSRLDTGDTFYIHKDSQRYTYRIYKKQIVKPNDVSVLLPTAKPAVATLITCDPPGTSVNRLIVVGEQISPDPAKNKESSAKAEAAAQTSTLPSNAPTLWSRLWGLLSQ